MDEDLQRPNPVGSTDTLSECPVVTCDAAYSESPTLLACKGQLFWSHQAIPLAGSLCH